MKRKNILTLFAICTAITISASPGEWETLKIEKGITVQRKEVPGSNHLMFRGMGVVHQPLIKILATIADLDSHVHWIGNSLGTSQIERVSKTKIIFYTATDAPWPVQDRDNVGESFFKIDKKRKLIQIITRETKHPKAPPRDDRVRMPLVRVEWLLKPMEKYKGQRTWLSFKVQADPGGWIPAWVANLAAKKIPFDTISNLRSYMKTAQMKDELMQEFAEFKDWY